MTTQEALAKIIEIVAWANLEDADEKLRQVEAVLKEVQ